MIVAATATGKEMTKFENAWTAMYTSLQLWQGPTNIFPKMRNPTPAFPSSCFPARHEMSKAARHHLEMVASVLNKRFSEVSATVLDNGMSKWQ